MHLYICRDVENNTHIPGAPGKEELDAISWSLTGDSDAELLVFGSAAVLK